MVSVSNDCSKIKLFLGLLEICRPNIFLSKIDQPHSTFESDVQGNPKRLTVHWETLQWCYTRPSCNSPRLPVRKKRTCPKKKDSQPRRPGPSPTVRVWRHSSGIQMAWILYVGLSIQSIIISGPRFLASRPICLQLLKNPKVLRHYISFVTSETST